MDKLFEFPCLAGGIVAEQGLDDPLLAVFIPPFGFMNAGRLAAAGALVRECRSQIETAPVHVFLHMRNNHIPLADQNTVARHQLQVLNEGQIVQAGPCHFASFDFYWSKDGYRRNLTSPSRRPLDGTKCCLKQLVLKFERQTVLIVMSCAPASFGKGNIIVGYNDAIDGNIAVFCILLQLLDAVLGLRLRQWPLRHQILARGKAQRSKFFEAFRLAGQVIKTLQNIEGHEGHTPFHALAGIPQAHRASRQITAILVGFTILIHYRSVQTLEITGTDKRLTGDYQTPRVLNMGWNPTDCSGVVSDDLTLITIAPCGRFHQFAVLIGQFDGKAVQLEHDHHLMLAHKPAQIHAAFYFIQRKKRDFMGGFL